MPQVSQFRQLLPQTVHFAGYLHTYWLICALESPNLNFLFMEFFCGYHAYLPRSCRKYAPCFFVSFRFNFRISLCNVPWGQLGYAVACSLYCIFFLILCDMWVVARENDPSGEKNFLVENVERQKWLPWREEECGESPCFPYLGDFFDSFFFRFSTNKAFFTRRVVFSCNDSCFFLLLVMLVIILCSWLGQFITMSSRPNVGLERKHWVFLTWL